MTVTINSTPYLVITNPSAVCSPSIVDLTAEGITTGSTLAGGVLSYWEDADTTMALIDPTKVGAGIYYIKASTAEGCFDIEPVTVTVNASETSPSITITQPTCFISTGSIRINEPLGSGLTYSINGNSYTSGTLFSGLSAGTYTVTVKNLSTCVSSPTNAIINQPPTLCGGGIFGTAETCSDFRNGVDTYKMNKICFTTKSNKIFNVTPGQFFYYFAFKAPAKSFCISVIQTKTNGYRFFRLQQSNQIVLWNENCTKAATGIEIRPDSGRVCISNAIPGAIYVLSAKYDSKSVIGSTAPGTPITSQYSFESTINGSTLEGSKVTIDFTPNCSGISQNSFTSSASEMNVAISENEVKQTVVNAYPNPYLDIINFDITPATSGKGDLALYDIAGRKLGVIYEGNFVGNNKTSIQYKAGKIKTATAIYILTIGDEKIVGKLFKGN